MLDDQNVFAQPDKPAPMEIFVACQNVRQSDQISRTLDGRFNMCLYTNARQLIDSMSKDQPDAVVVSTDMPMNGGLRLLEIKSGNPLIQHIPVIVVGPSASEFNGMQESKENNFFLREPYSDDDLIRILFNALSTAVEKQWAELPDGPRQALTLTVNDYKGIADSVATGQPIDLKSCQSSCEVLSKAVENGEVKTILDALKQHHDYTYVHSMRVATLLSLFGHGVGLRGTELHALSTAGLLHDIGKMLVPERILSKPDVLSDEEWKQMKCHVHNTVTLLDKVENVPKSVTMIAAQHHEKLDGKGYPSGIKDKQINDLVRMATIADIFGALTDERSYKKPFSVDKSFEIMTKMEGAIDQHFLSLFREIFSSA